jgi:hypothetical protein
MLKPEKALLSFFSAMDKEGQISLLEYAEFLAERHPAIVTSSTPRDIARPNDERLDKQVLLHETSTFMMQHIMQGRDAVEVIDDLEIYFKQQYEQFNLRQQSDSDS